MRSVSLFALVAAGLSWCAPLHAQGSWNAILNIDPYPSPYYSDWDVDPRIATLTVFNTTTSAQQVRLTLHNGSAASIGYNLCTAVLEHETGTTWSQVRTGEMCTMEIRSLPAGQSTTFDKTLPADLQRGNYRYLTNGESPAGTPQAGIASNAFAVP